MARIRYLWLVVVLGWLAGCANSDSIYRTIRVEGKAVAVDAKQRGIYSIQRADEPAIPASGAAPTGDKTSERLKHPVICPEPSPDALSAYAASGGLTALLKSATGGGTDPQVQGAFAFGEAAGSIGLRTQSIQLLRDGLFSNCLAYLNQAVDADQFYQLQRRSQNFTLGLLAIEQLTGAVKADQIALSTTASGATGSDDVTKQQEAVTTAEKTLNADKEAFTKAVAERTVAEKDASESVTSRDKAQTAFDHPAAGISDADKTALASSLEKAKADAKSNEEVRVAKAAAADRLAGDVASDQRRVNVANEQLTLAMGRVKAFASGTAQLAVAQSRAQVASHISTAVQAIVESVLTHSGPEEACTLAKTNLSPQTIDTFNQVCPVKDRVDAYVAVQRGESNSTPGVASQIRLPPETKRLLDLQINRLRSATPP